MPRLPELQAGWSRVRETLLHEAEGRGHWTGELSTSALSTATAVAALRTLLARAGYVGSNDPEVLGAVRHAIGQGAAWLTEHANRDGGWGDTARSDSNLSTTVLVWAALNPSGGGSSQRSFEPEDLGPSVDQVLARAEAWIRQRVGSLEPRRIALAVKERYGDDRTFSVPILTLCAVMGRLGEGTAAWDEVIPLPFELAAFPPSWFAALRLPVVSYALPALIAMGYARHYHAPSRNPVARVARHCLAPAVLRRLTNLQPPNGGFLEATPLTSFVVLSLVASGQAGHPVVRRGVEFLLSSRRGDGGWPIDTNLSTWLTTLAVNALAAHPLEPLPAALRSRLLDWLLGQQFRSVHPYTQAAPGGWAWTDLPGGVPDADDTSGALLALKSLDDGSPRVRSAVEAGLVWLMDLQNRDGGVPTFCRGWGRLPFDRSNPDITAHAVRAWLAWGESVDAGLRPRLRRAVGRGIEFLFGARHEAGYWLPLWFGNQYRKDEANPVYGTARVLPALTEAAGTGRMDVAEPLRLGVGWLVAAQQAGGGWGGDRETPASVEETALALEALAGWMGQASPHGGPELIGAVEAALERGSAWLLSAVEDGTYRQAAPIGFYFSKLWYFERLYPTVFTAAALARCIR